MRLLMSILFAALALPGVAQALDPRSEAAALYNAQQATISVLPTTTPTAAIVPGYAGDATNLHGYATNGAALSSAGQSAIPGSDIFQTTTAASGAAGAVAVSNADGWLQRSLSVVNEPSAYAGGAQGSGSSSCEETGATETVTTESLYTCESGTRVTQESPTCTRVFSPDLSGDTGQVGWSYYTCQEGYRDDPGTNTCDVPLQVTTSTRYNYECELYSYCQNGLNQEQIRCGPFLAGGCTRTSYYFKYVGRSCRIVFVYSCPSLISGPFNNEVVIRHTGTVPGTATASWNETACQALASDATCTLQSEICIEGAGTRNINGVNVYKPCWKKRRTYSCSNLTQGAGCYPPAGAQFLTQTCLAETQADVQTRNTQFLLGSVGEKAIVVLKIVTELLFIGLFPILLPAFLLPAIGLKLMQGYFGGFLYLQLWGPMYVILHKIMMGSVVEKTAAAGYLPGQGPGLKISNIESIGSVNADIAATAGVMILMIPVLAGLLTRGAMAVGSQVENLQPFRSGAEAAGAASATGNISLGNTAFDNHAFNNLSGNRWQTSASVDAGNAGWTDGNLNTHQFGSAGAYAFTGARSSPAVEMRMSEGVSNAATQQATRYRDLGQAVDRTWSEAQSRVRSDIVDASRSWSEGRDWRSSVGTESRTGVSSFMQELDGVSTSLQQRLGVTEREAKQLTARAAAEVYGDASLGVGVPGTGTGAKAGVHASAGVDASRSRSAESQVGMDAARQELSSRNWGDKVERYTADMAQQSWSSNAAYQQTFKEVQSDTFSSSQAVTDTLRKFENEGRRWEERADFARTQSASMERTYAQEFAGFAEARLLGGRDAYGAEIDRQRLGDILNPRNAEDRVLLEETAQSFFATKAAAIEPAGSIAGTREATSPVDSIQPFSASRLSAGRGGPAEFASDVEQRIVGPGEGRLGVPQSGRADVQESVRQAEQVLDQQGELTGKVFPTHARNIVEQTDALQAAQREFGERRLRGEVERAE